MDIAFFFDMDGVLFDSMPLHAASWEETMLAHGLPFTKADCFRNEGRTGQDVIHEAILMYENREATEDEIWDIYEQKTQAFHRMGGAQPMKDVVEVLRYLRKLHAQIWVVTGSGQATLFTRLNEQIGPFFERERMITAYDVTHGKPDPEPYLIAWDRSRLPKKDCYVIENAPLGVRSGKAAGLTVFAVNTGPLPDEDLQQEGADMVLPDMLSLLEVLRQRFPLPKREKTW